MIGSVGALKGFVVAILLANGFQQDEMTSPRKALEDAGATTYIIAPEQTTVQGWDWTVLKPLDAFKVDVPVDKANPKNYDALLIPGGYPNIDDLRLNPKALEFVKGFSNKPIASICHGPLVLIDANLVRDKTLTSYPSIENDLKNAGAIWLNNTVVCDGLLVTSRSPEDLTAFNAMIVKVCIQAKQAKTISK